MFKNWIAAIRTCNLPDGAHMDCVSRWLIITRACVFSMTLVAALIGIGIAHLDGAWSWGRSFLVLLGLVLAHASNNMLNDLFDVRLGVDTEDYPRANYAPHPILNHLTSEMGLMTAIAISTLLDLAIAVYFSLAVNPWIVLFAASGLFLSAAYVAPPFKLKHRGLGELAVFLIWGPLIVGGTFMAVTGYLSQRALLVSVPYGIAVSGVLMGKHLDKMDKDGEKGVRTLPVLLGQRRGRLVMQMMVWAYYLGLVALVVNGDLPRLCLLALLSLPRASRVISTLHQATPSSPEEAFCMAEDAIPEALKRQFSSTRSAGTYPLWPLWFVAWGVWWVKSAGGWLVTGLLAAAIIGSG